MNKTTLSILIGVASSLFLIGAITWIYPSTDDLWIENPFWNGLSDFYSQTNPTRVQNYDSFSVFNTTDSTLFIIGPYRDFTKNEADAISNYIKQGGTLILLDDYGTGNQLLEILDIDTRFTGDVLRDPVFRDKNSLMPLASIHGVPKVDKIVLNIPTTLAFYQGIDFIGFSSSLSYTTQSLEVEPREFFQSPIFVRIDYGNGNIFLLSDSSIFINSMLTRGDNLSLLKYLAMGTIFIDEAHSMITHLTLIKNIIGVIFNKFEVYEVRYLILTIFVIAIILFRPTLDPIVEDEVKGLHKKHPEYDIELLDWLIKERRKARDKTVN